MGLVAAQLADLVCPQSEGSPGAARTCAALRANPSERLEGKEVPTGNLRRTYRARLSRPAAVRALLGSDRLLSDLDAYDGETVLMVVFARGAEIFTVILDETASRLVTCIVGRDRRVVASTGSDA